MLRTAVLYCRDGKQAISKREHTPAIYVPSVNLEHVDCTSTAKPTTLQIAKIASVISVIQADRRVPASFIQSQAQALHAIDLNDRQRTVYHTMQYVREELDTADNHSYKRLPGLLKVFAEFNSGSTKMCESTDDGRFRRSMIVFGAASGYWTGMQYILGIYGAHYKNKLMMASSWC